MEDAEAATPKAKECVVDWVDFEHKCRAGDLLVKYLNVLEHVMKLIDQRSNEFTEHSEKLQTESGILRDDLLRAESVFAQLHERYQKLRVTVDEFEKNEEILKKTIKDSEQEIVACKERCAKAIAMGESRIRQAESESIRISQDGDLHKKSREAALKKAELEIVELKSALEQKTAQFNELSNICDDMLAVRGKSGSMAPAPGAKIPPGNDGYEAF